MSLMQQVSALARMLFLHRKKHGQWITQRMLYEYALRAFDCNEARAKKAINLGVEMGFFVDHVSHLQLSLKGYELIEEKPLAEEPTLEEFK